MAGAKKEGKIQGMRRNNEKNEIILITEYILII